MKTSESIIKIAPALLSAQKEIGAAKKDAKNPFFHSTYADLGSVMEACKDTLNKYGILVLQPIGTNESGVFVETVLLHESGEWISEAMKIAPKSETNPQDQGSAISYARRYSLQSLVFIPATDDDGERATAPYRASQNAPKYSQNTTNAPITSKETKTGAYMATDPQITLIYKLLKQKGHTKDELMAKYEVTKLDDLTAEQASTIIVNLKKLADQDLIDVDEIDKGLSSMKTN